MACIEHYVQDAENIFIEIEKQEKLAQSNVFLEFIAARTIQRWFRGYITRKHLKRLNKCATTIQKYWRGYVGRRIYFRLLQDAVHKMYWDHYNLMATRIQKTWRGHYVRTRVFSYYRLKEYINSILQKNKEMLELAKEKRKVNKKETQRKMEEECQEWLTYLSFKVHHLLRTQQIEGVYSLHGTTDYSAIEKQLRSVKFTEYVKEKRAKERKQAQTHEPNYIFKGRLRECEEAWLSRNNPGKYSLATGEYGLDEKLHREREKAENVLKRIQDEPMVFGAIKPSTVRSKLAAKQFPCFPLNELRG